MSLSDATDCRFQNTHRQSCASMVAVRSGHRAPPSQDPSSCCQRPSEMRRTCTCNTRPPLAVRKDGFGQQASGPTTVHMPRSKAVEDGERTVCAVVHGSDSPCKRAAVKVDLGLQLDRVPVPHGGQLEQDELCPAPPPNTAAPG